MIGTPADETERSLKIWQTKVGFWQACLIALVPIGLAFITGRNSTDDLEAVKNPATSIGNRGPIANKVFVKVRRIDRKLRDEQILPCNLYLIDRLSAFGDSGVSDVFSSTKGGVTLFGKCHFEAGTIDVGVASVDSTEGEIELLKLQTEMMNIELGTK